MNEAQYTRLIEDIEIIWKKLDRIEKLVHGMARNAPNASESVVHFRSQSDDRSR